MATSEYEIANCVKLTHHVRIAHNSELLFSRQVQSFGSLMWKSRYLIGTSLAFNELERIVVHVNALKWQIEGGLSVNVE